MRQKNEVKELMRNQKIEGFESLTKVLAFPQNEIKPVTVIWFLFCNGYVEEKLLDQEGKMSFW